MTAKTRPPERTDAVDATRSFAVLNLVTNAQAQFYRHQIDTLESQGVTQRTLPVPGDNKSANVHVGETETRSLLDYARFVPTVVRQSFGEYDLLHANYGLTAPAALVQPNLPVVLSLWGSDLMGEYGWVTERCASHADAVVVMSDRMAAELDRECYVIPHGVNLDRFAPEPRAEARAALGWAADENHVFFPYPPKRPVKDFPRAERVAEAAADRLDETVTFHSVSGVAHAEMPTYMNAADALLLTSKREGSPNTVKEALACNLPVVATNVGDVPERLDGVTHSYVCETDGELIDGLVAALEAGERSNGREHAREVSLERMGERILAVYADVCDDTG